MPKIFPFSSNTYVFLRISIQSFIACSRVTSCDIHRFRLLLRSRGQSAKSAQNRLVSLLEYSCHCACSQAYAFSHIILSYAGTPQVPGLPGSQSASITSMNVKKRQSSHTDLWPHALVTLVLFPIPRVYVIAFAVDANSKNLHARFPISRKFICVRLSV